MSINLIQTEMKYMRFYGDFFVPFVAILTSGTPCRCQASNSSIAIMHMIKSKINYLNYQLDANIVIFPAK